MSWQVLKRPGVGEKERPTHMKKVVYKAVLVWTHDLSSVRFSLTTLWWYYHIFKYTKKNTVCYQWLLLSWLDTTRQFHPARACEQIRIYFCKIHLASIGWMMKQTNKQIRIYFCKNFLLILIIFRTRRIISKNKHSIVHVKTDHLPMINTNRAERRRREREREEFFPPKLVTSRRSS